MGTVIIITVVICLTMVLCVAAICSTIKSSEDSREKSVISIASTIGELTEQLMNKTEIHYDFKMDTKKD